jgi:hypothetical protein
MDFSCTSRLSVLHLEKAAMVTELYDFSIRRLGHKIVVDEAMQFAGNLMSKQYFQDN